MPITKACIRSSIFFFLQFIFSQVENVGDQYFTFQKDGQEISIPVFSNVDIQDPSDDISRMVILIHGQNRNADDYYDAINEVVLDYDLSSGTMIIVPQFLITEDLDYWQLDNTVAFWSSLTAWHTGNKSHSTSDHQREYEVSSFAITDSMVTHYSSVINDLQSIVIVGKSAGGQYVNRYLAGSGQDYNGLIDYVIIAGSSYLYFDGSRYTEFLYPIAWATPNSCNGYDNYKYGLGNLNEYMSLAGADSIISRYQRRDVRYLIGSEDDGGSSDCRAEVQGNNRYERAILYHNHLRTYFGEQIINGHKIAILDGINHDTNQIFNSDCFKKAVFDVSSCSQFEPLIFPTAQFSVNTQSGHYPLTIALINESVTGTHEIQQLRWNIDGNIITSEGDIDFVFDIPGHYDITLTATDQIGLSDTVFYQSMVQVDTLYGDIDFDTEITIDDANSILRYLVGEESLTTLQRDVGDVSYVPGLTPFDGSVILQYASGSLDTLPFINIEDLSATGTLFSSNTMVGNVGDILTVPISIIDASNVYSFSIELEYDNTILESGSLYFSDIVDQGFMVESTITETGSILIVGASAIPFGGTEIICNLYFIPGDFNGSQTNITCLQFSINEDLIDQNFQIIVDQSLETKDRMIGEKNILGNNFPNPFNSKTLIRYNIDQDENIHIYITDIQGRIVRLLYDGMQSKGYNYIVWDGTNSSGAHVTSGLYFYTIETSKGKNTKKMSFVR